MRVTFVPSSALYSLYSAVIVGLRISIGSADYKSRIELGLRQTLAENVKSKSPREPPSLSQGLGCQQQDMHKLE